MRLILGLLLLCSAGCIDSGNGNDGKPADLAIQYDLVGIDFLGAYNCAQLNACEKLCRNLMCVSACRQMATPSALGKEVALQGCFNQYCPQDPSTAACGRDQDGKIVNEAGCNACLANTLQATSGACTPSSAPECTKCFNQAQDCNSD
jgi:hypothetical protein